MGKSVAKIEQVRKTLMSDKMTKELSAALPDGIDVERFQRIAMSAIQQNEDLLNMDRKSLWSACITAAQAGLYTDGFTGEAYLVPFKKKVQFQPGYRGLVKLARRSGTIESIHCHVVYENDEFDYILGDEEVIRHKPKIGKRGDMQYVYAIAVFKGS